MNVVNIGGVVRKVAAGWNELTKAELLYMVANMEHLLKPSFEFRLRLMLKLLGVPKWRIFTIKKLLNVPVDEIAYMTGLVDWCFPVENVSLTRNFFRTKYVLSKKYIGPADGLSNLSLEEFSFADHHFRQYMTTLDMKELDKLCAVLWRVPGAKIGLNDAAYKNDKRLIFNSYAINESSKRFKWTSKKFKFFVLLFFWGCRNKFSKKYEHVFDSGPKEDSAGLDLGWINVMFDLAGGKFGTLNDTGKQGLTTILLYLENLLINQQNKE